MQKLSGPSELPPFSILGNGNFLEPLGVRFVPEGDGASAQTDPENREFTRDENGVLRIPVKNAERPGVSEIVRLLAILSEYEGQGLTSEHPAIRQLVAALAAVFRESLDGGMANREWLRQEAQRLGISPEFVKMLENASITPSKDVRGAVKRAKLLTQRTLSETGAEISSVNSEDRPWNAVVSELELQCSLAAFRSSQGAIRTMLRTFSLRDREALVAKYANDPAYDVSTDEFGKVRIKKNGGEDTAVITVQGESYSRLPDAPMLFESFFDVGYWKDAIRSSPEHKRGAVTKSAVTDLLQGLHDFPWNVESLGAQNPLSIARTWEMQCVGKAIVWHAYLKALEIPHTACLTQNHISLLVRVDGKQWLFDPADSPAQLLLNEVWSRNGNLMKSKTIGKPGGGAFEYESVDAETGCYFTIMLNSVSQLGVPAKEKIPLILRLIDQQMPNPVMGYFTMLSELYLNVGEIGKALDSIRNEEAIHPQNVRIAECRVDALFANGDFVEAAVRCAEILGSRKSAVYARRMRQCFEKLWFPRKTAPSEEAEKYGEWVSKRKKYALSHALRWLRMDCMNPEAWKRVWLSADGEGSRAAYEIMTLLQDPAAYGGFLNVWIAGGITATGMRLLLGGDEPGLVAWAETAMRSEIA